MSWLLSYAILLMAAAVALPVLSWHQVSAVGVVVLLMYVGRRAKLTEPKTKVLLTGILGDTREAGPGLVIPLPDEWIATVNESEIHSAQKQFLDAKIDVDSKNKEFVTLDISVVYQIVDMAKYLDLKPEDFRESVTKNVKSFATDFAHKCKDLDQIYEKVENDEFEAGLLAGFRELMPSGDITVQEYYGIEVDSVIISDPEPSEEVKKAAQEKLAAKKRAEALAEEIRGLNKAVRILQGRTPKGKAPDIDKDRALLAVQRQLGKAEGVEEFGLSPATLKTIEKAPQAALPIWLSALLNRFSKANSGKRGGGHGSKKGGKP